MTTADKVFKKLGMEYKGPGQYRKEDGSPLRNGSNSDAFTLKIDDGEHGAYFDHVSGEKGSLYDLAGILEIETPKNGNGPTTKRAYAGLAEYAQQQGVTAEVFSAAGWKETTYKNRRALEFPTKNGKRWRFLDGDEDKKTYTSPTGYKSCWYGLERAAKIASETMQAIVVCNGEASTIVAQSYGLAACAVTAGEKSKLPQHLLEELQAAYTGPVLVALDCDKVGRQSAPPLAEQLRQAGYQAKAIDLDLGHKQDLADFCKLHKGNAVSELRQCRELSAKKQRRKVTSSDLIDTLGRWGYSFRMNATNDVIEVNGKPITDPVRAKIRTKLRDGGFRRFLTAAEDAYTAHAFDNQYHPVRDYLDSLVWDGLPQIDTLATYFRDTDDIFPTWLKRWMIGAVAKVYQQAQNPMLVLDGPQDLGKSYFAEWVGCGLPDFFIEGPINPDDKDCYIRLMSKFLWEVAELGATTRKADREALKFFITQKTVTVRKPFGRYDTNKPALCSLIGTINSEGGFLNDPTGSRRFLTCELTNIDWNYTQLDINQVWAEAVSLYREGETWRLTPTEGAKQREINARYRVDSFVMGLLLKYYSVNPNGQEWVSSAEILKTLQEFGLRGNSRANSMELSAGLKELGVKRSKKYNQGWGYRGVSRKMG